MTDRADDDFDALVESAYAEPEVVSGGIGVEAVARRPPYAISLADLGWRAELTADPALALGLNTFDGQLTYAPVADAHGLPHTDLADVLR